MTSIDTSLRTVNGLADNLAICNFSNIEIAEILLSLLARAEKAEAERDVYEKSCDENWITHQEVCNIRAERDAALEAVARARDDALMEVLDKLRTEYSISSFFVDGLEVFGADAGTPAACYQVIQALRTQTNPIVEPVTVQIDLVRVMFDQLCEAAQQSNWIPHDHYFTNDWVSDCCDFLRTGKDAIAGEKP